MSQEEYLTGEKRYKVKILIKKSMSLRMTNKEILDELQRNDIDISERTLRRLKREIHEEYGDNISDVYYNVVSKTYGDDLNGYEAILQECWKLYRISTDPVQKLKIIKQIMQAKREKHAGIRHLSLRHRSEKINYEETIPEGDSTEQSS